MALSKTIQDKISGLEGELRKEVKARNRALDQMVDAQESRQELIEALEKIALGKVDAILHAKQTLGKLPEFIGNSDYEV